MTRVKAARRALGMTAAELARLFGVSPETVSRWESGKRKPPRTADAVLQMMVDDKKRGSDRTQRLLGATHEVHSVVEIRVQSVDTKKWEEGGRKLDRALRRMGLGGLRK